MSDVDLGSAEIINMTGRTALLWVACLASLLTTASSAACGSVHCNNLLPGADYMIKGVDLRKLDFYNRESYKLNLFKLTCLLNQKATIDDKEYDLPDQITWTQDNVGDDSYSASVMKTLSDVTKKFSVGVDVSVEYGPVAATASTSYTEMEQHVFEKEFVYSIVDSTQRTGNMELVTHGNTKLTLARGPNHYLPKGSYKSNKQAYEKFIERYGTHFFEKGYYGGVIRSIFKTESSMAKRYTSKQLETAASLSFSGVFNLNVGVKTSHSMTRLKTKFEEKTHRHTQFHGGHSNVVEDGVLTWRPTVRANPHLQSGKLIPIYTVIKDNTTREQMKIAVEEYLRDHYIAHIVNEIGLFSKNYKGLSRDLANLRKFNQTLRTDKESTIAEFQRRFDMLLREIAQKSRSKICPTYQLTTYTSHKKNAETEEPVYVNLGKETIIGPIVRNATKELYYGGRSQRVVLGIKKHDEILRDKNIYRLYHREDRLNKKFGKRGLENGVVGTFPLGSIPDFDGYNDTFINCYPDGTPEMYQGHLSKTKKGYTCQQWSLQHPTEHKYGTDANDFMDDKVTGNDATASNFCRHPTDYKSRNDVWCYTLQEGHKDRHDACDVPKCEEYAAQPGEICKIDPIEAYVYLPETIRLEKVDGKSDGWLFKKVVLRATFSDGDFEEATYGEGTQCAPTCHLDGDGTGHSVLVLQRTD